MTPMLLVVTACMDPRTAPPFDLDSATLALSEHGLALEPIEPVNRFATGTKGYLGTECLLVDDTTTVCLHALTEVGVVHQREWALLQQDADRSDRDSEPIRADVRFVVDCTLVTAVGPANLDVQAGFMAVRGWASAFQPEGFRCPGTWHRKLSSVQTPLDAFDRGHAVRILLDRGHAVALIDPVQRYPAATPGYLGTECLLVDGSTTMCLHTLTDRMAFSERPHEPVGLPIERIPLWDGSFLRARWDFDCVHMTVEGPGTLDAFFAIREAWHPRERFAHELPCDPVDRNVGEGR